MPPDDAPQQLLTTPQRRLAATALALVSSAVILAFLFAVFYGLRLFVNAFAHVLWPLAVAGILALMLRPVVEALERRMKLSRLWAIVVLYALVTTTALAGLALLLPTVIEQAIRLIGYLPDFLKSLQELVEENYPTVISFLEEKFGIDAIARLKEYVGRSLSLLVQASEPALATVQSFVIQTAAVATGLAILPIYLFFLLHTDRDLFADLREQLSFVKKDWREDIVFLIGEFVGSIVSFFRGQLVIALIMGVIIAAGFTVIGLNFAIVLGLGIGILNIIPYLGSIIGLATSLPLAYFQSEGGGWPLALGALAVFAAAQAIEGYFLTPRIMGQRTGLHPMVIIVAIFFWGAALDGILGMILAIPLTAFFVVAWRLLKRKYLVRLDSSQDREKREL